MQMAQVLAGYSLGGADLLRRAMGKKDKEKMAKERDKFVEGARRATASREKKADEVFDMMEKFAGYGFNKSPLRRLLRGRVPDGLPEGELPGRVHGRGDDDGNGTTTKKLAIALDATRDGRAGAAAAVREPVGLCTSPSSTGASGSGSPPSRASARRPSRRILAAREKAGGAFDDLRSCARSSTSGPSARRPLEALASRRRARRLRGAPRADSRPASRRRGAYAQKQQADVAMGQSSLFGGRGRRRTGRVRPPLPTVEQWGAANSSATSAS